MTSAVIEKLPNVILHKGMLREWDDKHNLYATRFRLDEVCSGT